LDLTDQDSKDVLRGITLEIYRLLLKTNKPHGIREIQRVLNLSSPSQAQYHLNKLEEAGLLKREMGNYVINKVLLENTVRISRFLIPRYLFYSVFALAILFIEVIFLRPNVLNREYFFFTVSTFVFVLIFWYETIKVWRKGSL
jgi:DNA-binding transcriptional ArsR family regulator